MTKARGAVDSIGKAGRGASFLLPAFSPYYVPYFPLFLRARTYAPTHIYIHTRPNTYILYWRSLSFLSSPLSPSTSCPILLRRSPSVSPHRFAPPSSSSSLLYVRVHIRVCVYVRLVSIVIREVSCRTALYAPAARGRLCTWVNGKMSFETFLGRSRSPHTVSHTHARSRSRENARCSASPSRSFRSTMPRRCRHARFLNENVKRRKCIAPLMKRLEREAPLIHTNRE